MRFVNASIEEDLYSSGDLWLTTLVGGVGAGV